MCELAQNTVQLKLIIHFSSAKSQTMTKTFCTFIQSTNMSHYASPALSIYHSILTGRELASTDVYIYNKTPLPPPPSPPPCICRHRWRVRQSFVWNKNPLMLYSLLETVQINYITSWRVTYNSACGVGPIYFTMGFFTGLYNYRV